MPIRPQPLLLRCTQCNWRTTWQPRSDAFIEPPPSSCAKCGCENLQAEQHTGPMADLLSQLRRVISK